MSGKIYLIPSPLGDSPIGNVIPQHTIDITNTITHFVVENIRSARRFLSKMKVDNPMDSLSFSELNEHTHPEEVLELIRPALNGHNIGIISEAGVPSVADPGAALVSLAHTKGIQVIPLAGPSSILLALMASGFNGQSFTFNGYLPIKPDERARQIKMMEKRSSTETQIFMETPYRNNKLIADLLANCQPHTKLCIAADITLETEFIATKAVSEWKKGMPDINKRPCIFLIQQ